MKKLVATIFLAIMYSCFIGAQERKLDIAKRSDPVSSEQRIGLVIGNSTYPGNTLPNPVNDARDMAQALRDLSFEVLYGENLSQNEMKRIIRQFGNRIHTGGVGLFYYAGHGIQVNGRNYLIPISATITREEEVEYESVDVGLVLAQMDSAKNPLNIVILDACRNNPFAKRFRSERGGLASMDAPIGTLIAYATAPGSIASDGEGQNGLYTQELLKRIRTPGLRIEEVFKRVRTEIRKKTNGTQIPWESSALEGDFYFVLNDSTIESTTKSTVVIAGDWNLQIKPTGTSSTTYMLTGPLSLQQNGITLAGSTNLKDPDDDEINIGKIQEGSVKGDKVSFTIYIELSEKEKDEKMGVKEVVLRLTGVATSNAMSGTCSMELRPAGMHTTGLLWSASRR